MIQVKPHYGKRYTANCVWYCKNYSIITTSQSRDKCIKMHLEKLKQYGYIRSTIPYAPIDKLAMEYCKNPWKE